MCLINFLDFSEILCSLFPCSNLVEILYQIFILFQRINKDSQCFCSIFFSHTHTYTEEAEPEESEEPFVAPPGLAIPPDVELVSANISAASWLV